MCAHLQTRFGYKLSEEKSELSSERFATGRCGNDHDRSLRLTWFVNSITWVRAFATLSFLRVHGLPIKFATQFMLSTSARSAPACSLASLYRYILNRETQENKTEVTEYSPLITETEDLVMRSWLVGYLQASSHTSPRSFEVSI